MAPSTPFLSDPALISPPALNLLMGSLPRPRVLDVRTAEEYAEGHVPTATNLPLDGLDPTGLYQQGVLTRGEKIFLICRTSNRSRKAAAAFAAAGHPEAVVVEGGTLAWIAAQFPVETGPVGGEGAGT
jgi:rhodanese-related sulfurtransferase